MTPRLRTVAACVLTTAVLVAIPAEPAAADAATPPSALSSAAYATPASMTPTVAVSGALGGLLGPILNPVLSGLVNPLLSTVTALPQSLLGVVAQTLTGAGLTATSITPAAPVPANFPDCTTVPWKSAGNCYHLLNLPVGLSPVLNLGLNTVAGYTQTISSDPAAPATGAAKVALTGLSLLGISVLGTGAVNATAFCPTVGTPIASASGNVTEDLSLLGGLAVIKVGSSDGALNVLVGGQPLVGVKNLAYNGSPVTLSLNSNLVRIGITLNLQSLLSALGLGVAGNLLAMVASENVTLTVAIGPGKSLTTSHSAVAWGLNLGADLALQVNLNVLGLVAVTASVPSGLTSSGGGNLLNLKLAYVTCEGGTSIAPTAAIPPGVN